MDEHPKGEYPKGMFGFRLPPGYRVQVASDVLVLRRADGLMVAAFVAPGADRAEVEREAAEDHRRVRADARRAPRYSERSSTGAIVSVQAAE